LKNKLYCI